MKQTILPAMLLAIAVAVPPMQATAAPPQEKTAKTQKAAPDIAEFDKRVEQMNENLRRMDALMDKINQSKDQQERKQLLQQYWVALQEAMGMMHGMAPCCSMGGPGMMGGPGVGRGMMMGGPMMAGHGPMMGWKQMEGYYSSLTPEQQRQHQYMSDQYLRMQQMMMDRMMQHQYWMNQPQPAAK